MNKLLQTSALTLLLAAPAWGTIGLSSNLGDVVLENARPGRVYNLRESNGVAMRVQNTGDAPARIVTEVTVPEAKRLKEGYEPLPDPSWVQVLPERYELPPGGVAFVDILLRLPDDPTLAGRHFQFYLWTHQESKGFLAAGLETRVRVSLGKGPETLAKEKRQNQMRTFNFDLWPQSLYVVSAEAGRRYDVKDRENKSLRVINKAEERLELDLRSVPWPGAMPLPPGYEKAPDPSWLRPRKARVAVKGLAISDVPLELRIPAEHAGKKYAFWIQPALPTGLEFVSGAKIFVTVK